MEAIIRMYLDSYFNWNILNLVRLMYIIIPLGCFHTGAGNLVWHILCAHTALICYDVI